MTLIRGNMGIFPMSGQESEHTPLSPHSSSGNGTQESLSAETFTSKATAALVLSLYWQRHFVPSLNVSNWWVLWAELLTSPIIWNLQTPLWSEQLLFKLHHQHLGAQLGGKELPTRLKVAPTLALKCIQRAPGVLLCLSNLWTFKLLFFITRLDCLASDVLLLFFLRCYSIDISRLV